MKTPHPRLFGMVAAEANHAVIFRRGPSRLTQLLVWDLNTDEVIPGQWIKGSVYVRRCDVSPDGRYLVGAFTNYSSSHRNFNVHFKGESWLSCGWTAISRPPYFTAIGLWFTGGAWNGGGMWRSNQQVELNRFPYCWQEAMPVSARIRAGDLKLGPSEDGPIYSLLLKKRGWTEIAPLKTKLMNPGWRKRSIQALKTLSSGNVEDLMTFGLDVLEGIIPRYQTTQEGVWVRPFRNGLLRRIDRYRSEQWQLIDSSGKVHRDWTISSQGAQWLDLDANGCPIFGDAGCLWKWPEFPDGAPSMVADLNENRFEAIAPPDWAKQW